MLNRQFTNRLGNVAWPPFGTKAFWRFTRDLWPLLCVWDHGTLFSFWLTKNSSKFLRHLPVPHFSALKTSIKFMLCENHIISKLWCILDPTYFALLFLLPSDMRRRKSGKKKYLKPNQYHQNVLLCHKWIVNKNPMCLQNLPRILQNYFQVDFDMWF